MLPSLPIPGSSDRAREGLDGRMYVGDIDGGGVMQVDSRTGALQTRFSPVERGFRPRVTIDMTADRKTLYVAELIDTSAPHLARYDVSGAKPVLLQSVPVNGYSGAFLSVSNSGAFVTFGRDASVAVRSGTDLNVIVGTFTVDSSVVGPIMFARDDSRAFVSTTPQRASEHNLIGVFDLKTFQRLRTIVLPETLGLSRIAVDNTSRYLFAYTTNGGGSLMSDLDVYQVGASSIVPRPKRLLNVSTRLRAAPGDGALIGEFIISGSEPKKVAVRALGPSLPVGGKLPDPTLALYDASGASVTSNENWNSRRSEVLQVGLGRQTSAKQSW